MADKSRSVSTKFWTDSYIEELNPSEKLLFLYCLTSPQSNLLGIYEVSTKRITFETRLNETTISNAFKRFERDKKLYYVDGFIVIPNFLLHQNLNTNMKIGVTKLVEKLPNELKTKLFGNDLEGFSNHSEPFERIRNTLLKLEIEKESEIESEKEIGKYSDFIKLFNSISNRKFGGNDEKAKKQFQARLKNGWTIENFKTAIENLYNDSFHKESGYKYATPEFITRSDKLEMYYNKLNEKSKEEKDVEGFNELLKAIEDEK